VESNGGCQHDCESTIIGSYSCTCHTGFVLHENQQDCEGTVC